MTTTAEEGLPPTSSQQHVPTINIVHLTPMPIFQQLQIEEALLRAGSGNWCLINHGTPPAIVMGLSGKIENPLERGTGHGIVGANEFIEKIRGQYIRSAVELRELPAVKKILAQVEPQRIIRLIGDVFGVKRGELLKKGYKGVARGVLMEMLYRYGGMNQREIGELMGIDYSAVSVMRKRLWALLDKDQKLAARIERMKKQLQQSQE